jgi:hypothetical protein
MRALSPSGAVRFGVCGNLSAISSIAASTLNIASEANEPICASG